MSRKLSFRLEAVVDDDLKKDEIRQYLDEVLSSVEEKSQYESISLFDSIRDNDDATIEIVDIIEDMPDGSFDEVHGFIEEMEDFEDE